MKNAYDLHVHVGPEPIPRRYDAVSLGREMQAHGMGGFVAKSHFYSTVPFAAMAEGQGIGTVWGSVTLNHAVGGVNPQAVRGSLGLFRGGTPLLRLVWMPTIHAAANMEMMRARGASLDIPAEWTNGVPSPGAQPLSGIAPISLLDPAVEDGLLETLDVLAENHIALATGHISRDEVFRLVPLAKSRGVDSIVLTHPIYASTRMTDAEMRDLTEYAHVYAEFCYVFMAIDHFSAEEMAAHIRAVGPDRVVLSTDSGQPMTAPPYACLDDFHALLKGAGFTGKELERMSVGNPKTVLGL